MSETEQERVFVVSNFAKEARQHASRVLEGDPRPDDVYNLARAVLCLCNALDNVVRRLDLE